MGYHSRVGVFKKMQKEESQVELDIEANLRQPPQRRQVVTRGMRIQTIFSGQDETPFMDFLRGIIIFVIIAKHIIL